MTSPLKLIFNGLVIYYQNSVLKSYFDSVSTCFQDV